MPRLVCLSWTVYSLCLSQFMFEVGLWITAKKIIVFFFHHLLPFDNLFELQKSLGVLFQDFHGQSKLAHLLICSIHLLLSLDFNLVFVFDLIGVLVD